MFTWSAPDRQLGRNFQSQRDFQRPFRHDWFGFQLLPWTPSLGTQFGHHVSGVAQITAGWIGASRRKR